MNDKTCIFMGNIPVNALFLMRLENAFLLNPQGAFIEVVSQLDNLENDLISWLRFKGEKFISKTTLAPQDSSKFKDSNKSQNSHKFQDSHKFSESKAQYCYLMQKISESRFQKFSHDLTIAPVQHGLAPNGVAIELSSPDFHFGLNNKDEIYSENLSAIYESAKAQSWNATTDIKWSQIPRHAPIIEFAIAQIMTYLTENEFSALYIPARFLSQVSPYHTSIPLLLSSIIGDEARHIESFIKRANATGLGVQYSSLTTQQSLYTLWNEKDYFQSSFLLHIMGEGTFIDLLKFLESAFDNLGDSASAQLMNLARRDESRHTAYGMNNVKNAIAANSHKIEILKNAVFRRKNYLDSVNDESSLLLESLSILAGGGNSAKEVSRGYEQVVELKKLMEKNRTKRLVECGIPEDLAQELSKAHTPNFM